MELRSYAELAVRLVNTAEHDRDRLGDLTGLRSFLSRHPSWRARVTDADLARLRVVRAAFRAVFEAAWAGDPARAVRQLNDLLARSVIRPHVSDHDGRDWHLHLSDGAAQVSAAYASAAAMGLAVALTEAGADRLGVCACPPCRNVFLDTSTNRTRRYCSQRCATRANVAAHRARRRAADE